MNTLNALQELFVTYHGCFLQKEVVNDLLQLDKATQLMAKWKQNRAVMSDYDWE